MRCLPWFFLLFTTVFPCPAEEASFLLRPRAESWEISASLNAVKEEEILSALEEGLESEIVFQFRLYERAEGFFAFMGDRLLAQQAMSYRASMDLFDEIYVIQPHGGEPQAYTDKADFLSHFLRLEHYAIAALPPKAGGERYLLARIRLTPVVLSGPLTIISLFFRTGTSTEWFELSLEREDSN